MNNYKFITTMSKAFGVSEIELKMAYKAFIYDYENK